MGPRSACGVRFISLPDLDAIRTHRWRPFRSASPIWTPLTQSHGVRSTRLSRFGRHLPDYMASVLHAYPVLDAIQLGRWRPYLLLFPIWTPPALTAGVHSAQLLQSGRLSLSHMASAPHNFPVLDASHTVIWRPFRSTSPFWTPLTQSYGVRSAQLPRFGRHPLNQMASIPAAFPNLAATKLERWRPFCSASPIWTPLTQSHGVHSAQLPQFGRHTRNHTASNFAALLKLDATHSITWRPLRTTSPFWTPPTQSHGVHSAHLLQSGRLVSQHVASNLSFHRHLDAMQHLDAMLHQNSPSNIPGIPQNKTGNCLAFHNSGKRAVAFISLMRKVYSPKGINLLRILFGYCLSWNLLLELLFAGFSLYQFNYFYYWDYQD